MEYKICVKDNEGHHIAVFIIKDFDLFNKVLEECRHRLVTEHDISYEVYM